MNGGVGRVLNESTQLLYDARGPRPHAEAALKAARARCMNPTSLPTVISHEVLDGNFAVRSGLAPYQPSCARMAAEVAQRTGPDGDVG